MMRSYVIPSPKGIDSLTLVERPDPTPGPRQVLVRVHATSLNYRDLLTVEATYSRAAPKADLIPLSDGAGEVVAVGPGVSRVKTGDRVAGCFMQKWIGGAIDESAQASAMGGAIDGMLTEMAVLEEDGVVKLPAGLSFEEGATLPCAAVTAWHALVEIGNLKAGDIVLIQGSGGVSIFALQFAKMAGARVIATSSSAAKAERLKEMGAEAVIDYRATPDWDQEAMKLTGGRGADVIVEVGGAGTLPRSFTAARLGGRIAVIGLLTGMAQIDPMPILRRNLRVQGLYVGSKQMFESMNRAIEAGSLKPVIDKVFPFAQAKEAYRHLKSQSHFGKIVIAHG
jgi:NADPH:quinone reductase-like Zn-dependent oxidoreductase